MILWTEEWQNCTKVFADTFPNVYSLARQDGEQGYVAKFKIGSKWYRSAFAKCRLHSLYSNSMN